MTLEGAARRATLGTVVLAAVLALAGCGAPAFTYVTNSDERTYLKVPAAWRQIDGRELAEMVGVDPALADEQGLWMAAYDADAAPSPAHLFGRSAEAPAVFVVVQQLSPAVGGQFSLDSLRDLFYPVSATARSQVADNPLSPYTDFALLADEVLTPGQGVRGVHSVFRYRIGGGPLQIIDQTAFLNDDASTFYVAFARCSMQCYNQRQQEIQNVISSFTVRRKI